MNNILVLEFIKTLLGKYSNEEQSINNPMLFAHINIFFIALPLSIFNEPLIYSEQSYNYNPWSPYRQSLHKFSFANKKIILESYGIKNNIRVAGAGFNPSLLHALKGQELIKKNGCSMQFNRIKSKHYVGEIEPGKECLARHSGKTTYISSKVEFNNESWTVIDEGFDIETNEKVWGSQNGPIKFKKIINLSSTIDHNWIK